MLDPKKRILIVGRHGLKLYLFSFSQQTIKKYLKMDKSYQSRQLILTDAEKMEYLLKTIEFIKKSKEGVEIIDTTAFINSSGTKNPFEEMMTSD